ncbi:MAG: ROK family protein [Sphingobium sp.]|nr:ROK family protein [Sphingobium sp.]
MTSIRLGIDFGGTKIEIAALDESGGYALRERVPNPGNYDASIVAVRELVLGVERKLGARGTVGIGTPGSRSPRTGLMRNANSTWLNGRPFKEDLEAALGREIHMANDANCLVLSEALDGAGAGKHSVFGVIIGTGCGGGLVIDGKLVDGASAIAGEVGHTPLPWPRPEEYPGVKCWCGLMNCLEVWVSGSGFQRAFEVDTGRKANAADIVAGARAGQADESAALDAYIDRLARALAMVANIVDPDCFVLGGGMSNVSEIYPALPDRIRHYAFSDCWDGEVVPAKWGDSSGVRGAAMLWD